LAVLYHYEGIYRLQAEADGTRLFRERLDRVFGRELGIQPLPWLGFLDPGDAFAELREQRVKLTVGALWWPGSERYLPPDEPHPPLPTVAALPVSALGRDFASIRRASGIEVEGEFDFYEVCDPFLFLPSATLNRGRLILATVGHERMAWYAPRDPEPRTPAWLSALEFEPGSDGPTHGEGFKSEAQLSGSRDDPEQGPSPE
jgi:hypothetical protein